MPFHGKDSDEQSEEMKQTTRKKKRERGKAKQESTYLKSQAHVIVNKEESG